MLFQAIFFLFMPPPCPQHPSWDPRGAWKDESVSHIASNCISNRVSAVHTWSDKAAHKCMTIKQIPVRDSLTLCCAVLPLALCRWLQWELKSCRSILRDARQAYKHKVMAEERCDNSELSHDSVLLFTMICYKHRWYFSLLEFMIYGQICPRAKKRRLRIGA